MKQINEAVKRMKVLNLPKEMIGSFEKNGTIYNAQNGTFTELNERQKAEIAKFETERNARVFLIITTAMNLDFEAEPQIHESYLYVSEWDDEWESDMEELINSTPFVYVNNVNIPYFSEFGRIQIECKDGTVKRIW